MGYTYNSVKTWEIKTFLHSFKISSGHLSKWLLNRILLEPVFRGTEVSKYMLNCVIYVNLNLCNLTYQCKVDLLGNIFFLPIVAVSSVPFPIYSAPLPPVNEVGEASAVLPAYSCDPSGSDLPRGNDVLCFYSSALLTCVLLRSLTKQQVRIHSQKKCLLATRREWEIIL